MKAIVQEMQQIADKLGIPLRVYWTPKNCDKHGELHEGDLTIYDSSESAAWATFQHELFEFKFKDVIRGYRLIINGLIEVVEKMSYMEKEKFLEFNVRLAETLKTSEVTT